MQLWEEGEFIESLVPSVEVAFPRSAVPDEGPFDTVVVEFGQEFLRTFDLAGQGPGPPAIGRVAVKESQTR
jgi:hypothetical protein